MNPEIYSVLKDMQRLKPDVTFDDAARHTYLSTQMSILLVLLAEEAEKNAIKAEKATIWIVRLTWVIAILTAVLVLTVFFEFPKKIIQPNQNPSLHAEQPQKDSGSSKVQEPPKDGEAIPNVGK